MRLHLENFLTFDRVVMKPKPQLNVIVGPNGIGKSSVVCAICLGLGGSTTLLGRAKDLKDFVKHGKDAGFVEITLFDDKAPKHPTIRRAFSATSNSSHWTVNRRTVKAEEVKKLVNSLNIQLDNFCMFLPQDKVVEFARMNKQELLVETERAIGPKELHQHHEELSNLKKAHTHSHDDLRKKKESHRELERRNNLLQRDVERFMNKKKYEDEIMKATFKKHWLNYESSRDDLKEKRKSCKNAKVELKRIKDEYQPIKDQHKAQEGAVERYKEAERGAAMVVRRVEGRLRGLKEQLRSLEDKVDEPRQELESAKKEEAVRKRKIENLRREIEGFKKQLEELEPTESLTPKIADKNAAIRQINQSIGQINEQQQELHQEVQQQEERIRQSEVELRQMNSVWKQRLERLRQRDASTAQVIEWLQGNQHKYQQPILEPVCMSLNVRDARYVKQAEAFFSGRDFYSFVAQSEEDKEKFLREVRDSMRLKVNIVLAPNSPLTNYKPGISFQELRGYNFQQMLLDVVEAPEPVLCFFCQYQGLHHIPIAGALRPEEITRITNQLPQLRSFFTSNMRFSVKRSLYRNAVSTRSNELYSPRFLVASVDTQRKEQLEREMESCQNLLSQMRQQYQGLEAQDRDLRKDDARLRSEKTELRKIMDSHKSLRANINSRKSKLEQHQHTTFDLQEAEEKCKQAVNQIQTERVQCLGKLKGLMCDSIASTDESVKALLQVHTAEARVGFFLRQYRQMHTVYEEADQRYKALTREEQEAMERAQRMLEKAKRETGVSKPQERPEIVAEFGHFPNELEAIEDVIHELMAKAQACVGTDQSVVDEFNEREKQIKRLMAEISRMESDIETRDTCIESLKQMWLVPLKELLSQVNDRFRKYFSLHMDMEGAGEVRLDPDPDANPTFSEFDKFGVQIKVKFRDNEQLQDLNAQRQSGGERSVSTMLYLMALQGTTSCPFRVVDEINQGMDPENERRIFNLIVHSACNGAQYFLLSPKLLQNLEYSDAVAVNFVNNGSEIMPCEQWNLDKILA